MLSREFGRHQTLGTRSPRGKENVYHCPIHLMSSTGDLSQVSKALVVLGGDKKQNATFWIIM